MIEFGSYSTYAAPPLIGALIGYLTNRVAIRMLFRPLKKWKIAGVPVPMTPGVIPSKRHELALNIGEMVSEHLLTSEEINKALSKDQFQSHLYETINYRLSSALKRDFGTIYALLPLDLHSMVDDLKKEMALKISDLVVVKLRGEETEQLLKVIIDEWLQSFLVRNVRDFLPDNDLIKESLERLVQKGLHTVLQSSDTEDQINKLLHHTLKSFLTQEKPLDEILPEEFLDYIKENVHTATDYLLGVCSELIKKPSVQKRLSKEAVKAILAYIETLGPMAAMIQGFVTVESLEEKINDYLAQHEDEIAQMVAGENVRTEVALLIDEKLAKLLATDCNIIMAKFDDDQLDKLISSVTSRSTQFLSSQRVESFLSSLITKKIETQLTSGELTIEKIANQLTSQPVEEITRLLHTECKSIFLSSSMQKSLEKITASLIDTASKRPIGKISHYFPPATVSSISTLSQTMLTRILAQELPSIVPALDIKNIVTTRIDSFDLLRLEKLLLSIMEEQFKYINLFGGLLGFLIGFLNLLFFLA